jgi:hypothetical protein
MITERAAHEVRVAGYQQRQVLDLRRSYAQNQSSGVLQRLNAYFVRGSLEANRIYSTHVSDFGH